MPVHKIRLRKVVRATLIVAAIAVALGWLLRTPAPPTPDPVPVPLAAASSAPPEAPEAAAALTASAALPSGPVRKPVLHKKVPSIHGPASQIPDRLVEAHARWSPVLGSQDRQDKVAAYYADKYGVAFDDVREIVYQANQAGRETNLNPLILIAIVAHESNFIPTVRNKSGAEGLMQVMTAIHKRKFKPYGGERAAFTPAANLRVGALVLKQCIALRRSLDGGLRYYAGAGNSDTGDNGFVQWIHQEEQTLRVLLKLPAPRGPQRPQPK